MWLTIDGEYIIDLTLGTWLANTEPFTHYGSIISGMVGALSFQDFADATKSIKHTATYIRAGGCRGRCAVRGRTTDRSLCLRKQA